MQIKNLSELKACPKCGNVMLAKNKKCFACGFKENYGKEIEYYKATREGRKAKKLKRPV